MKVVKCLLLIFAASVWGTAWAVPGVINYQGRLTDSSGSPITGATNVTFTFWSADAGGTQLGTGFFDTDSVTPDSNGIYSTDIGDDPGNLIPASVFAGDSVWLNVNVGGEDLVPRLRIESAGYAIHAANADTATTATNSEALQGLPPSAFLNMSSDAYVVVKTTSDPTQNGANLLAAYAEAKALTPNGAALSATNRATVLVPPGNYNLGTSELTLDTEFVDLIGLSSKRNDQYIYGTGNGANTGVIRQTATDVGIENLLVQCTAATGLLAYDDTDPAAYFPNSDLPATVLRNCEFRDNGLFPNHSWSTRLGITYSGTYADCTGGDNAFGLSGTASGTFTDCTGGYESFGASGVASGIFTRCTGGDHAFGDSGTASGTFTDCTGGDYTFGAEGTASGTFIDCTGGINAFGGYTGGTASGTFIGCRMTGATWTGTWNGTMQDCQWAAGITAGDNARIYNSKFLNSVNLNGSAAGIANSYVKGSIYNTGLASFNSGNVQNSLVN